MLVPAQRVAIEGLDGCRAALRLNPTSRELIAAFKYRQERRVGRWLGAEMVALVPLAADQLTWVPTTSKRRRQRGYDQARELALVLGRLSGVPARKLLVRGSADARQTGQSRAQRLAGPALRVCGPASGFVVVVDDVMTTGSSLRVAADLLRQNGANRVVGLVGAATPVTSPPIASRLPLWK